VSDALCYEIWIEKDQPSKVDLNTAVMIDDEASTVLYIVVEKYDRKS
jgi:hypothetical protein